MTFFVVNGSWFALNLCLLAVFARYIAVEVGRNGGRERVRAAVWLATYFVGETGWRGLVWWHHGDAEAIYDSWAYYVLIGFGVVGACGALGCVAIFAPEKCGTRSVAAAILAALAFAAASWYLA